MWCNCLADYMSFSLDDTITHVLHRWKSNTTFSQGFKKGEFWLGMWVNLSRKSPKSQLGSAFQVRSFSLVLTFQIRLLEKMVSSLQLTTKGTSTKQQVLTLSDTGNPTPERSKCYMYVEGKKLRNNRKQYSVFSSLLLGTYSWSTQNSLCFISFRSGRSSRFDHVTKED